MIPRRDGDAGQAFPIYITVVAGLLFLALAYLAVGQAAVNRGGAQTAADAAALAAAQDVRDQLTDAWVEDILDPTKWDDIFAGTVDIDDPCTRAGQLAEQNDAQLDDCGGTALEYTADVTTNKTVGDSVVPGTDDLKSSASATAVIKPLCSFELSGAAHALPSLDCDGTLWDLKPDGDGDLPGPEDLFDVHLADRPVN
ncbi:pilus assembly protein TadG-related protein [Streptomyces sp. NPDC046860]|uniref:pilus assembly protein TadG-related protein n=1 Tax=Streptomyces sp. NPDC046860 TaxID=3154495 RepID=UPI0033E02419